MVHAYLSNLQFLAFVAVPVLCTFAVLGERIVEAFLKPDWFIAGTIVSILAFARVFNVLEFFMEAALVCTGHARRNFVLRSGYSIIVTLGVLAIARFGPVAVALWQLAAGAGIALIATLTIGAALQVRFTQVLRALALPALVTVVCAAAAEGVVLISRWPAQVSVVAAGVASLLCLGVALATALRWRVVLLPRV